ncbi:hypothetical protein I6N90_13015 [Paenibacillus sp. GSMTC-2017]|uniref:hypothetical protein n=1 Tax=Paenibacillus sp. GSMTC-2017 TaxID=2794350 RepID=UPI0018D5ECC1|nr:hypothetical protein [Paenibacillus sp. GSMTC-2017]MBH5318720.1 hypothetical protein [Paenibacillus sp. GSMTC-2017]
MSKLLFTGLLFCLVLIVGSDSSDHIAEGTIHEQTIEQSASISLQFSKLEGTSYTPMVTIKDTLATKEIITILNQAPWENIKALMSRMPDYTIRAVDTSPDISSASLTYSIWVSPNKDLLFIGIDYQAKYSQLTIEDSKTLLSILKKLNLT